MDNYKYEAFVVLSRKVIDASYNAAILTAEVYSDELELRPVTIRLDEPFIKPDKVYQNVKNQVRILISVAHKQRIKHSEIYTDILDITNNTEYAKYA